MGLFDRFSSKEVDTFAKSLAEELAKQYPPAMENPAEGTNTKRMGGQITEKRLTRILETLYEKALVFRATHKLGVYRKARLGNTFRWELESLGYSRKFIDVAVEGLVVYMSRKPELQVSGGKSS